MKVIFGIIAMLFLGASADKLEIEAYRLIQWQQ